MFQFQIINLCLNQYNKGGGVVSQFRCQGVSQVHWVSIQVNNFSGNLQAIQKIQVGVLMAKATEAKMYPALKIKTDYMFKEAELIQFTFLKIIFANMPSRIFKFVSSNLDRTSAFFKVHQKLHLSRNGRQRLIFQKQDSSSENYCIESLFIKSCSSIYIY